MTFGWSYPAGVTGNEPEIAGWPPCRGCGHDVEEHGPTEDAPNYGDPSPCGTPKCGCTEYRTEFDPWLDGPDPDAKRDREREGW